jgi:hypothetical protein
LDGGGKCAASDFDFLGPCMSFMGNRKIRHSGLSPGGKYHFFLFFLFIHEII